MSHHGAAARCRLRAEGAPRANEADTRAQSSLTQSHGEMHFTVLVPVTACLRDEIANPPCLCVSVSLR
jgi:hypothetical protein